MGKLPVLVDVLNLRHVVWLPLACCMSSLIMATFLLMLQEYFGTSQSLSLLASDILRSLLLTLLLIDIVGPSDTSPPTSATPYSIQNSSYAGHATHPGEFKGSVPSSISSPAPFPLTSQVSDRLSATHEL